jgi:membrane-bound serine protease (ClpP class)
MNRWLFIIRWMLFSLVSQPAFSTEKSVVTVELGVIGTASVDILESAMLQAERTGASALVICLDTPGGLLDSTRKMVREILNSKIPVIVWVGPKGARAASAGAFITMAAHVAVMAPATNIGAAHPVGLGGIGSPSGEPQDDSQKNSNSRIAMKKTLEDTLAMVEAIAKARNRNIEMARSFVLASEAITAEEALASKVIDFMADSVDDALTKATGKSIIIGNDPVVTLDLTSAKVVKFKKSIRHSLLEVLSNPDFFYLLFIAGLIGLGFELTHPGAIFPGVVGAICMLLALIAMSTLPVNLGAFGLMLAGVAMMVAELFLPSFGSLGVGGLAAFVIGSLLLVDPSGQAGLGISVWTVLPGALALAIFLAFIGIVSLKAMRGRVRSGQEGMVGKTARASQNFVDGQGHVRVDGEIWNAKTLDLNCVVHDGDDLLVEAVEGLLLTVSKKQSGTIPGSSM